MRWQWQKALARVYPRIVMGESIFGDKIVLDFDPVAGRAFYVV